MAEANLDPRFIAKPVYGLRIGDVLADGARIRRIRRLGGPRGRSFTVTTEHPDGTTSSHCWWSHSEIFVTAAGDRR